MEITNIRLTEHLAVDCPLCLVEFCGAVKSRFGLPTFEYDSENETKWGLVVLDGIEYNISRPYKPGTLQEWDNSVPMNCNFGVTLIVSQDCPPNQNSHWSLTSLVPSIAQGLADLFGQRVYHHRTRLQGSVNVIRNQAFQPIQSQQQSSLPTTK